MCTVQSTFTFVVFGAVGLSLVHLAGAAVHQPRHGSGSIYDEIGSGGLIARRRRGRAIARPGAGIPRPSSADRELEIRQMLGARSERLVARGEPAT